MLEIEPRFGTPSAVKDDDDAVDAAKWRALINAPHLAVRGSLGLDENHQIKPDAKYVLISSMSVRTEPMEGDDPHMRDFSRRALESFVQFVIDNGHAGS